MRLHPPRPGSLPSILPKIIRATQPRRPENRKFWRGERLTDERNGSPLAPLSYLLLRFVVPCEQYFVNGHYRVLRVKYVGENNFLDLSVSKVTYFWWKHFSF